MVAQIQPCIDIGMFWHGLESSHKSLSKSPTTRSVWPCMRSTEVKMFSIGIHCISHYLTSFWVTVIAKGYVWRSTDTLEGPYFREPKLGHSDLLCGICGQKFSSPMYFQWETWLLFVSILERFQPNRFTIPIGSYQVLSWQTVTLTSNLFSRSLQTCFI